MLINILETVNNLLRKILTQPRFEFESIRFPNLIIEVCDIINYLPLIC